MKSAQNAAQNQRVRIIHTVTNDLNFDQRMQRICTSLTQAGFDCVLVGREKRDSKPLAAQIFTQKRLRCFFEKGPFFYLEFNVRLCIFLLLSKFSILNAVDTDTILPVLLISTLKNKKRVFDAHEFFEEVPEVTNRKWVKYCWKKIALFAVPKFHRAYTVGDCLAEIFSKKYRINFETIRNVPFLNPPKTVQSESEPIFENEFNQAILPKIILYQGALNADRGLEESIFAMKMVSESAVLWLAGEGDLSQKLREIVATNALEKRVKFLGFVRPTELKKLSASAFIGLNLLKMNGLSYFYSLANKFFDYLHVGVPSLNMNFPEYKKIIVEHEVGLLLEDCDSAKIAAAINHLISEEHRYARLQKNAKSAAKIFNWELESAKLVAIYSSLVPKN